MENLMPRADFDPYIAGDEHIKKVKNIPISKLAPFSGLIMTVCLVIFFILKQYVLEKFLLRRIYKDKWTNLNPTDARSFLNNHIAGATKALILLVAAYPFINVAFRYANFNTPYAPHSTVTLGDILVVCTQMLLSMYVFELFYRISVSPISSVHHIGTIIIGQSAIAISLQLDREPDAAIEFILCTVWGAFDIVCELLPHISIILYRVYPDSHKFLSRVFFIAMITTFGGTLFETAVVMYLFGSLWTKWTIAFKIVTPLLHLAFAATQFHGTRVFRQLWKKQERLLREEEEARLAREDGLSVVAPKQEV